MENRNTDRNEDHRQVNNSDNLKQVRQMNLERKSSANTKNNKSQGSSSGAIDSLVDKSTLGLDGGTGQNYSGGTRSGSSDQNRNGSMSGQTGSSDAAGKRNERKIRK